jgi:hypothetical protein
LGNVAGRENELLFDALRFLGMKVPPELTGCSCTTLLEWGVTNLSPQEIPSQGGILVP